MITIRPLEENDWEKIWPFMEPNIRSGETYPYAMDMSSDEAYGMWVGVTEQAYVAEDETSQILGTYYIKPNQPTLGAHVANCGYIVAPESRGKGIATQMCEHSQAEALTRGYRAMQYNLVVATNDVGYRLWTKLGFETIGRLKGAFNHREHGYVDAYIKYKTLV